MTKSSGEVSPHTINILASWMVENPYDETSAMDGGENSASGGGAAAGGGGGGLTRSESTSAVLSKVTRSSPVQEVGVLKKTIYMKIILFAVF